jgi:hypothetical protein
MAWPRPAARAFQAARNGLLLAMQFARLYPRFKENVVRRILCLICFTTFLFTRSGLEAVAFVQVCRPEFRIYVRIWHVGLYIFCFVVGIVHCVISSPADSCAGIALYVLISLIELVYINLKFI